MEYIDNKTTWDQFFQSELETLQQKMPSFDIESLSKSKLRLSIENKILDWKKYESWAVETYGCTSLKENVTDSVLKGFSMGAQQAYDLYATHNFWNQDLLPVAIWENQVIVIGLQYHSGLQKIPNHVFILAHPKALNFFASILLKDKAYTTDFSDLENIFAEPTTSAIEGLDNNAPALEFDFKNLASETVTNFKPSPRRRTVNKSLTAEQQIWELITERHAEYVFESRKQYDAFLILRNYYDLTHIFKMDPDLEKRNINEKLFEYNLKQNNAFKQVMTSKKSQTLEATQLGLDLLGFNFVSITPIKRRDTVVGFFVAFKNAKPTDADQNLLDELAQESAEEKAG